MFRLHLDPDSGKNYKETVFGLEYVKYLLGLILVPQGEKKRGFFLNIIKLTGSWTSY